MRLHQALLPFILVSVAWLAVRTAWLHVVVGSVWAWLMVPVSAVCVLAATLGGWRVLAPTRRAAIVMPILAVGLLLLGSTATAAEQTSAAGVLGTVPLLLIRDEAPAWSGDRCFDHMLGRTPDQYTIYLTSDAGGLLPMHRRTIVDGLFDAFDMLPLRVVQGPPPEDPAGDAATVHVHVLYKARIVENTALAGQYCDSQVRVVATSAAATWPTVVHEVGHHFGLVHSHGFMVDTQQVLDPPSGWTTAQEVHLQRWAMAGAPAPGHQR